MTFRIANPNTHLLVEGIERSGQMTTKPFPPQSLQSLSNQGKQCDVRGPKNFIYICRHSALRVCLKKQLPTTTGRPTIALHQ